MVAAAVRYAEPSAPLAPSLEPRWRDGRLWIGKFLVPERQFLLHAPCPLCGGPAVHDTGELRCMLCTRELVVDGLSAAGRVTSLRLRTGAPPGLVRVAPGQPRRTARALSRADGSTGLAARILRLVPKATESYVAVETLATQLAIRRELVRGALEALESQGLVEQFTRAQGYRTGWRRIASSGSPGSRNQTPERQEVGEWPSPRT